MSIGIESANEGDVEALVELLIILFSIEQNFTPDETAKRKGMHLLLNNPDQGRIFVARHPHAGVVGMVIDPAK
jgi:hypothetical protein